MPMPRSLPLVAAAMLVALFGGSGRSSDRFAIWRDDGTRESTPALPAWPLPGAIHRFGQPAAGTPAAGVRLIHDLRVTISRQPPYLVLANGDVLRGTPVQLEPDLGRRDQPLRLSVQLEPPLAPVAGTSVSVRTDRVQRIVLAGDGAGMHPPGTVILSDGRRLLARSIRWREQELALLTAEGVVEATFSELADVTFPRVDATAAVLEDNLWGGDASGAGIARLQTAGGSVLTAARLSRPTGQDETRRSRTGGETYYYVQPAWSSQPVAVPEQEIVSCGYRFADEAPLSLLPAETIVNRRLLGQAAPWTANQSRGGGLLSAANLQSDLGIAAHAESAIAFRLPPGARTLQLWVGLDRGVGAGGCVRCKVVAEGATSQTKPLWESGLLRGRDGAKATGPIDVSGLAQVVLVTEFAHDDRPVDADPFDIRDAVVWLAPLVTLDAALGTTTSRALAILPGASEWDLAGPGWGDAQVASRWNPVASQWDPVLTLAKSSTVALRRRMTVSRSSDIVELLTICPADLEDHDFALRVNGEVVPWRNNADRNQLRQWTLRYSRSRARDGEVESNLTDRLAYWWDLSAWRGQEVALELTLRGRRDRSEVAWRGLVVRGAIGNLADDALPRQPDVPLTSLTPVPPERRDAGQTPKNATLPIKPAEPIRFLGQEFSGGYGLSRDSSLGFPLLPEYRSFVAVVGCCYQVAGPVQVLIDGQVCWERAAISSLSPAEQIEIAIPAGAKTLSLECGADSLYYGSAAFAEAGFMTR